MAAQKPDVAILEVGLGGRLDAVNIVDADCAVITSIDLDHMDFLGPDRESIGLRRPASCAAARPAMVTTRCRRASVMARGQRNRRRALAVRALTSTWRASGQQWGWSRAAAGATARLGLSGAARRQPADQRGRRAGGARSFAADSRPSPRRRCAWAWPWSSCRGASRSCRASPCWC